MPIDREKFYRNRSGKEIERDIISFLKAHPDEAFESEEIEKAIKAGPGEKKLVFFKLIILANQGIIDGKREIVRPDGYHEIVKHHYIMKKSLG